MTLRPEFGLGNSPYNAFLFSTVGEEKVSGMLTVFSALTRLGLDPWQEAARLAALPRHARAQALAPTIAKLPLGDWTISDAEPIAARLVAALPERNGTPAPSPVTSVPQRRAKPAPQPKSRPSHWLIWGGLVLAALLGVLYMQPSNDLEPQRSPFAEPRR